MEAQQAGCEDGLAEALLTCRAHSLDLCAPLSTEDHSVQGADFASPPKWHLAHTTWFFDTFILQPAGIDLDTPEIWHTLFNSYYNGVGTPHTRAARGILSRPALAEVLEWRTRVDAALATGLSSGRFDQGLRQRIELGIEHEMQHQELLLTDLLYSFSLNPMLPAYDTRVRPACPTVADPGWLAFNPGITEIGATGNGFAFDNEMPRHRVLIHPFELATQLVSNREYQGFISDGGYRDPQWWLSDGWTCVQTHDWQRPLHWLDDNHAFSLQGVMPLDPHAPVTHLSGFEADAYARWCGCRLPTEFEWEYAAQHEGADEQRGETRPLHPGSASPGWFGNAWQWTQSAYTGYPGFETAPGAVGEYNGKFMSGQWVLRGSSFATPIGQQRITYRNFFYPQDRWQFTGLRLAR